MIIFDEDRPSDSPFVERVWRSHSEGTSALLSTAESRCELVVSRINGKFGMTLRGPETHATSQEAFSFEGEWLGIRLKPGVFFAHLPAGNLVDGMVHLPEAAKKKFWLQGSAWQFPDFENADTFVARLVRQGLLVREKSVTEALAGCEKEISTRSVQRRFLHATGLTRNTARRIEQARYATFLLRQGISVLDTVQEAGYFDQPHLTKSLKFFIGQTPLQIRENNQFQQLSFLYKTVPFC